MSGLREVRPSRLMFLPDAVLVSTLGVLALAVAAPLLLLRGRLLARDAAPRIGPGRELILQPNTVVGWQQHGDAILEHFAGPAVEHSTVLDPAAAEDAEWRPSDRFTLAGWRVPAAARLLEGLGLRETAVVLRELLVTFRLQAFAAQGRFDVLRSIQHEYSALRGEWVARSLGLTHIVEVAGNYELLRRLNGRTHFLNSWSRIPGLSWIAFRVTDLLLGYGLTRAFRVFGRNRNNYEHAFALGAPVERLSLIRIRLNVGFFELAADASEPPLAGPYLLFVARMGPEKFPGDVMDAFERVADAAPDLKLVLIGDGPLLAGLRARAASGRFADRVVFLGARSNREVVTWTRHAHVAFETYSGSALVEKMLCGIPIVCYDVEWMGEVIIDGFTGLLADFRDTAHAAERIRELLADRARARELGARARELALAMFDREKVIARESRYLREAVRVSREGRG